MALSALSTFRTLLNSPVLTERGRDAIDAVARGRCRKVLAWAQECSVIGFAATANEQESAPHGGTGPRVPKHRSLHNRLSLYERYISLILLSEVQPKDCVEAVQNPPQVTHFLQSRPFWWQFLEMSSENSNHVSDFQMHPAHRRRGIFTADQLRYCGVHRGIFGIVMR